MVMLKLEYIYPRYTDIHIECLSGKAGQCSQNYPIIKYDKIKFLPTGVALYKIM